MDRNRKEKKNGRFAPAAALLAILLLTACGQKADEMNESSISAPPASVPVQESSEPAAADTAPEDSRNAEAQPDAGQTSDDGQTNDDEKKPDAGPQPETPQTAESGDTMAQAEQDPSDSVSSGTELLGDIEKVGNGMITINKIFTEKAEDGSDIAWSSNDNKTLLEISYTDQTVFIVRSSTDGGITHTDAAGSAADLKKELSILATGAWDGDIFRAAEIVIYHFG